MKKLFVLIIMSIAISSCKTTVERESFAGLKLGLKWSEFKQLPSPNSNFKVSDNGNKYYVFKNQGKEFYARVIIGMNADSIVNRISLYITQSKYELASAGDLEEKNKNALYTNLASSDDGQIATEKEIYLYLLRSLFEKYKRKEFKQQDMAQEGLTRETTVYTSNDLEIVLDRLIWIDAVPNDSFTPVSKISITYRYNDSFARRHNLNTVLGPRNDL